MTESAPKKKKKKRRDRLIGTLLAGKYEILKKIGEGGMGSVYIANQQPIDRKVAVKVLLGKLAEDEIAVKRFEQEARAISKMQHPNTITIYDFGHTEDDEDDERLYIVMEYLKGMPLTNVLREEGHLPAARACRIVRQMCASLADAHATGIIHRDLKPDNIFLTEVGGDKDWVKVLDFGVAKLADAEGAGTLTQTGMIFGTPKYMSPEQAEGRPIDYRADIYAVGVVLYELITGRPPFVADTPVGLLLKHISEPPPPFARIRPDLTIDPRIEAIVMKSLDKVPDRRHQAVGDLAKELEGFERSVSGPVSMVPTANVPVSPLIQQQPGMPTEVVPGSGVSPDGLRSPAEVPGNLSLSVQQETKGVPQGSPPTEVASSPTQPEDAMKTAQGEMAFGQDQGLTHPVPAGGAGIETLGGLSGELSGRIAPPKPRSGLFLGGLALLVAAGGLIIFLATQEREPVVDPIAAPVADNTKVADPTPKPPDPPPTKVADPEPVPVPKTKKKQPERRPGPRKVKEPTPPPPVVSKKVVLKFVTTPPGALVKYDGKEAGRTPFKGEFAKGDAITFSFEKSSFKKISRVVWTNKNRTVEVELKKIKQAEKRCPGGGKPPCTRVRADPKKVKVKVPTHTKKKDPTKDPLNERVDDLKY